MFEAAEREQKISKQAFNELAPDLRLRMVRLQQSLRAAGHGRIRQHPRF